MSDVLRILIVDDHPDTADAIGMLLGALGHETHGARTGREGLAAFDDFRPELVILDIGLPDLSGYELASEIRARPLGREAHLVAATGWGAPEDRGRALAAGFDEHFLKPLDLTKLRAMIASLSEHATTRGRGDASRRA